MTKLEPILSKIPERRACGAAENPNARAGREGKGAKGKGIPAPPSLVRRSLEKAAKHTKYQTIVLTDKQAVLVKNKKVKIIGSGKKVIFNPL